jgi:hypothetical protein
MPPPDVRHPSTGKQLVLGRKEATKMFKRTLIALVVAGSLLTPLAAGVTSADSSSSNSPTWFCTKVVDADSGLVQIGRADNGKEKAALDKQGYECTKSQQSASQAVPEPTPSVPSLTPIRGHRGR